MTVADYDLALQSAVAAGGHGATYMTDTVHPTAAGHALASSVLEPVLLSAFSAGENAALPARIYSCENFEFDPVVRVGTDNDGETGTWSTVGSGRRSSVAGSIISWAATCSSFGAQVSQSGTLAWRVDAGGWTNINLASYGSGIEFTTSELARAAHTIDVQCISGTIQIDRFISI